jgi:thiosulfate/3-mercaptopyruvate sulfurtransferase
MDGPLIEAEELNAKRNDPLQVIVDCRYDLADPAAGLRAYVNRHIPGAVYAHLHDDLSGPPFTDHGRHPMPAPADMERLFGRLGIDNQSRVAVYDDSGGSIAARLWWMLRYMGHERANLLDGGWHGWIDAGFETESGQCVAHQRVFRGSARRELLVTLDQVGTVRTLIDSRDPARYSGEHEPLDPVAGHIPGAKNYFWKCNLDSHGAMLAPARVRMQLQEAGCRGESADTVFYCGSGVTACFNVLAAVHAGMPMPRLYAGSWSEWCSDPGRPVETGGV